MKNFTYSSMGMSAEDIRQKLAAALPEAVIELVDLAGDNEHYSVTVTSPRFTALSRVAQHRLVNDAFGGGLGTELHALQIITKTPNIG